MATHTSTVTMSISSTKVTQKLYYATYVLHHSSWKVSNPLATLLLPICHSYNAPYQLFSATLQDLQCIMNGDTVKSLI